MKTPNPYATHVFDIDESVFFAAAEALTAEQLDAFNQLLQSARKIGWTEGYLAAAKDIDAIIGLSKKTGIEYFPETTEQ